MELIKDLGMDYPTENSKRKYRYGLYKCPECPKEFRALTHAVKNSSSTMCQSCSNRIKNTTHGDRYTRLYSIWSGMKDRCSNSKSKNYQYYGALGIKVWDAWKDYLNFKQWAELNGYEKTLELDRKENSNGYEPSNCRWVTENIQAQNKRALQSNNTSGYKGAVYLKRDKKWEARIKIDNKSNYLGRYSSAKEAGIAYNEYIITNNLEHTLNEIKD